MHRHILTPLALAACLGLVACDGGDPAAQSPPHANDGHSHAGEDAHAHAGESHDHASGDPHAHAGERHELGAADIGGFRVVPTQIDGVTPGQPVTFEIRTTGEGEITAVRAWVGVESGVGSLKAKAPQRRDFYDADLEVPAQLPEDAQLWVEIETPSGTSRGAFDIVTEP